MHEKLLLIIFILSICLIDTDIFLIKAVLFWFHILFKSNWFVTCTIKHWNNENKNKEEELKWYCVHCTHTQKKTIVFRKKIFMLLWKPINTIYSIHNWMNAHKHILLSLLKCKFSEVGWNPIAEFRILLVYPITQQQKQMHFLLAFTP